MFVVSNHFRINSKIDFHDKSSHKVLSSERAVIPFLKWFDTPDGELAYKFFKMSNKKKFVADDTICVNVTPAQKNLLDLLTPVETPDFHDSLKTIHALGTYYVPHDMVNLQASSYTHLLLDALQQITQETLINKLKLA